MGGGGNISARASFCLSVISEATLPATASLNKLRLDSSAIGAIGAPPSFFTSSGSNMLTPNVNCGGWV